jgi:hypothetical protein
MKARGRLVCLVCVIAALALPAAAAAKPGYYVIQPQRFVKLDLRGADGYGIHVISFDAKRVVLFTTKGGMSATYTVRGRVTDDSIEAKFGDLGRVSVHLRPSRPPAEGGSFLSVRCKGRPATDQEGRFVGTIRFRGEGGYTSVRASSAHGSVFRSYRQVCKRRKGERPPRHFKQAPVTSLGAASTNPRLPWFSAFKEEAGAGAPAFDEEAQYSATQSERREGMRIDHSASATTPPETFAVSPPGASPFTGTVAPPAPFSGTATYERLPEGKSTWSGDLEVELPGLGRLPLTGPTYRAKLCRSFACACPVHECFFVVVGEVHRERPLQRLLGRLR